MILKRLTLDDFGVYSGRQELDLAPTTRDTPIVLIGGRNGEGKTTLLEAVLLALYGPHALGILGRGGSYETYLRESVNRNAPTPSASVELAMSVLQEGATVELRVCRSWHATSSRVREVLTVSRDGENDTSLADSWQDFIEGVVPRGIAPLFFFDGERIEELADLERAAATLRTAIGSLLGLDLVEQLATDLQAIERRHAAAATDEEGRQQLDALAADLAAFVKVTSEARERLATARADADRSHAVLARVQEQYRVAGGELAERRTEFEGQASVARERVQTLQNSLREHADGVLPFALVRPALERLNEQAGRERAAQFGRELAELLTERDDVVLGFVRDAGIEADLAEQLRKQLQRDREQRRPADIASVACLTSRASNDLATLVQSTLVAAQSKAEEARTALDVARAKLEDCEARLAALPEPDALESLMIKRAEARDAVAVADARVERHARECDVAEREEARASEAQERSIKQLASTGLETTDSGRLVEHSEKARATLALLRAKAATRHLGRIEALIGEALDELLRKDGLIEGVKIDPDSYELSLLGRNGVPIPPKRLSAGERQLTALSLLWGLARASGRPLPVIIDTPLGRLDSSHRGLLVERYLPHASHQVIVLSTDTEVDREASAALNGAVGRTYRLDHDDEFQATHVTDGYFFERPVHTQ